MKEKIIGIYKIENTVTGKFYIGSSKNIHNRWITHKSTAKRKDLEMYKDMREFGIEKFIFSIVEECPEEELRIKEQYYIDSLKPSYNKVKASTGITISADIDFNEYHRQYLATQEEYNKEHTEYCRKWNKEHRDYFKKYYQEHKEEIRNRANNSERRKEYIKKYDKEHKKEKAEKAKERYEKNRAKARKYYLDHKEEILAKAKINRTKHRVPQE